MRTLGRLLLIAAAAATLAGDAGATTLNPVDVECPVCDHDFEALEVGSYTVGGVDSDGCGHGAPNTYFVWTCPSCRYTNWAGDFGGGVSETTAASIRKGLAAPAPIASDASQRTIPGWVKYDLLLRVLELEKAEPGARAGAALRGAWTVRTADWPSVRALRDGDHEKAWTRLREEFAQRTETERVRRGPTNSSWLSVAVARTALAEVARADPPPDDAALRRFRAASVLRRHGENAEARPVLVALTKDEGTPEDVAAAARELLASIDRERRFQVVYLRVAGEAEDTAEDDRRTAAWRLFVRAETERRLGRVADAAASFVRVLEHEGTQLWTFDAALASLERIAPEALPPAASGTALRKRCAARTLEWLADPETARSVARSIRNQPDDALVPGILPLLEHEDGRVRRHAAFALRGFPRPGDAAIDALSKLLAEGEGDAQLQAAHALHDMASPRSLAALRKGARNRRNYRVMKPSLRALGVVGEARDADVLLEYFATHSAQERLVCEALSRLANRAFDTVEAFVTWREGQQHASRSEWVRTGFMAAGVDLPVDGGDAEIRALLAVLDDERHYLRVNAVRRLRELTDAPFGWEDLAGTRTHQRAQRERRVAVSRWRRWWEDR